MSLGPAEGLHVPVTPEEMKALVADSATTKSESVVASDSSAAEKMINYVVDQMGSLEEAAAVISGKESTKRRSNWNDVRIGKGTKSSDGYAILDSLDLLANLQSQAYSAFKETKTTGIACLPDENQADENTEVSVGTVYEHSSGEWNFGPPLELKLAVPGSRLAVPGSRGTLSANKSSDAGFSVGVFAKIDGRKLKGGPGITAFPGASMSVICAAQANSIYSHTSVLQAFKDKFTKVYGASTQEETDFIDQAFLMVGLAFGLATPGEGEKKGEEDGEGDGEVEGGWGEEEQNKCNLANALNLNNLAHILGIDSVALAKNGLFDRADSVKMNVAMSFGATKFGTMEIKDWQVFGAGGQVSVPGAGVDLLAGKHMADSKTIDRVKVFLGISNFDFEYDIPLKPPIVLQY